jgi:hypothetical protein
MPKPLGDRGINGNGRGLKRGRDENTLLAHNDNEKKHALPLTVAIVSCLVSGFL